MFTEWQVTRQLQLYVLSKCGQIEQEAAWSLVLLERNKTCYYITHYELIKTITAWACFHSGLAWVQSLIFFANIFYTNI